ncbi:MAG: hypothetical protein HQM07_03170 [Zetaproteobacteria bacterium]|nr:hypothetical protein [Zetaproteobacteria bacterium]
MRVVICDAEWVIRCADRASDGGYQLECDGISEIVRGQQAILGSADTEIIADDGAATLLNDLIQASNNTTRKAGREKSAVLFARGIFLTAPPPVIKSGLRLK